MLIIVIRSGVGRSNFSFDKLMGILGRSLAHSDTHCSVDLREKLIKSVPKLLKGLLK